MQENTQRIFFWNALPLLMVLFIDGMGLGLAIPIINGLIYDTNSPFFDHAALTPLMENMIYGFIICIFMLCWFFGASILGDLSDQIGRKKSLIICLFGAFLSYLLSALSVSIGSLSLLIIGRIVAGITSGSQPIAQAAIIDLSTPENKTRNIGYILLALSLGFIFGPLIGGILTDNKIVDWFDYKTPFYFASLISFVNIIILKVLFKETFVSQATTLKIRPAQSIRMFVNAFELKSIRRLSIIFFIFIFGWSSYYSFVSVYLVKYFNYSATYISFFMAAMGIGFGIGNGFLVNYLAKFFSLKEMYLYTTLLTALAAFLFVYSGSEKLGWVLVMGIGCFVATAYACILSLFSNQVDEKSQGFIMGVTGSIMALVWAINGVKVGLCAAWDAALPMYIAAFSLFFAGLAALGLQKKGVTT